MFEGRIINSAEFSRLIFLSLNLFRKMRFLWFNTKTSPSILIYVGTRCFFWFMLREPIKCSQTVESATEVCTPWLLTFTWWLLLYACYGTLTCKVLLNWPHRKLGQHCADSLPNRGKRITRRCESINVVYRGITKKIFTELIEWHCLGAQS